MSTDCIICGGATVPFMQKYFSQFDLGMVDYVRCKNCGFVLSETHYHMPEAAWEALNNKWVSLYQGSDFNPEDPRWMERLEKQSQVIADWAQLGLLPEGRRLDYGAGDGKLADAIEHASGIQFLKYEHSSNQKAGYIGEGELKEKGFGLVLHTSVMEHLRYRSQLDDLFRLVNDEGAMCLHTWAADCIPQDPEWFYLLSVHCSFYTNRSLQILFEQYGYQCSIYNVPSRLWLWCKQPADEVRAIIEKANGRAVARDENAFFHCIFSERCVDYWK